MPRRLPAALGCLATTCTATSTSLAAFASATDRGRACALTQPPSPHSGPAPVSRPTGRPPRHAGEREGPPVLNCSRSEVRERALGQPKGEMTEERTPQEVA